AAAANDLTVGAVEAAGLKTLDIKATAGDVAVGTVNAVGADGSKFEALTIVSTDGADISVGAIDANSGTDSAFSTLSVTAGNDTTLSIGNIVGLTGKNAVSTYDVTLGDNIGASSIGAVTAESIGNVNITVGANSAVAGQTLTI